MSLIAKLGSEIPRGRISHLEYLVFFIHREMNMVKNEYINTLRLGEGILSR
jgi:hypothetical protein